MGKQTAIAWTDHTFNPWWGCEKVSPGCTNCYAEAFAKRTGKATWGATSERRFFGEKHWREPLAWNEAARKAGERRRVFCASMADVFEARDDLVPHRRRLFDLIGATPHLDWQVLTKRPENVVGMMREIGLAIPPNVWLGTSVEDQARADERIPRLLAVGARLAFLSCEPLLGQVDLVLQTSGGLPVNKHGIDWVIGGGESGPRSRPCDVAWLRSLRDQCKDAGVPFFCKQLGGKPVLERIERPREVVRTSTGRIAKPLRWIEGEIRCLKLSDAKGADPSEWPEDLRVQEFPIRAALARAGGEK
jgi:protein gp37